jgi:catechol 1,2-dioxygenase
MGNASDADRGFTGRVLKSYSSIEDPRLRSLVGALIRHLHAFVGETELTDQEWEFAWNFMGRMAAVSDRNEFLLAGDVLGVSQLIEMVNHDRPGQPVGFALVGPFLRAGDPFRNRGESIASDDTSGARVRVSGKVLDDESGEPLAGAVLDVWQAATNGLYENQDPTSPTTICGAGSRRIKTAVTGSSR